MGGHSDSAIRFIHHLVAFIRTLEFTEILRFSVERKILERKKDITDLCGFREYLILFATNMLIHIVSREHSDRGEHRIIGGAEFSPKNVLLDAHARTFISGTESSGRIINTARLVRFRQQVDCFLLKFHLEK